MPSDLCLRCNRSNFRLIRSFKLSPTISGPPQLHLSSCALDGKLLCETHVPSSTTGSAEPGWSLKELLNDVSGVRFQETHGMQPVLVATCGVDWKPCMVVAAGMVDVLVAACGVDWKPCMVVAAGMVGALFLVPTTLVCFFYSSIGYSSCRLGHPRLSSISQSVILGRHQSAISCFPFGKEVFSIIVHKHFGLP